MSASDPLCTSFFVRSTYTHTMGSARYTSKQTNEWLRSTMKKLGIASLDELSTMTKIDRGSLSRYFNQDRRPSIDAIVPICTALGVTSDELLIVLGAADNPDKKQ
jgi:transcriptional regulator with XRE-family HTH domain